MCGCEQNINNSQNKVINKNKMIGVWINYNEINTIVNECNTQTELNNKIKTILIEFAKYKINTIFLHCRAFDDCFYYSNIYLPSEYCKNKNGELKFDILKSFIEVSKEYNIEIHAWINPYRIRKDCKTELIQENSLAGEWYSENPEDQRIIVTENSIFYNPASVEIQKYVLDGIKEILENYSVAGIHIDDYFYPTTDEKIDDEFYNEYVNNGGMLSLSDFRRQCVNCLVSSVNLLVKSYDENLCFSISPSADIKANYNTYYADVELWANEKGYADYLIPQIYFGFEHETMPFSSLLNEWSEIKSDYVKIAVGLSVYKSGEIDIYAKSGSNEWIKNSNILKNQIDIIENDCNFSGYIFYSANYLLNDYNSNLKNEKLNILS